VKTVDEEDGGSGGGWKEREMRPSVRNGAGSGDPRPTSTGISLPAFPVNPGFLWDQVCELVPRCSVGFTGG
jgi:hypothetical protein